jgi:hypothetical protein
VPSAAAPNSTAASATPRGSGSLARYSRPGAIGPFVVSCSITSIGSDTNTGPYGGSFAILNARRMTSSISLARSTCVLHFVTGAAIAARSWLRIGSRRSMRVSCWPAVTTIGAFAFSAL